MRKAVDAAVMCLLGCAVTAQAAHAQAFSMREVTIQGHKKVVVEHFSPDIAKSEKEGFLLGEFLFSRKNSAGTITMLKFASAG